MHLKVPDFTKKVVFLEIQVGAEKVGKMVIELRNDVVPKAAENFRCLCTGEKGKSKITGATLCYKYTRFNTVKKLFMIQGGDVVKNNGSSGESIYGMTFESEPNNLEHSEGAVAMANFGRADTNNSQFYICAVDCPHLNDTNTVVGYVIRGLGCISEMEKYTCDTGNPEKVMIVSNCGEILSVKDCEVNDDDETDDDLPPFPRDWVLWEADFKMKDMIEYLECIKKAGNFFFYAQRYVEAARKYKKAVRYYNYFSDRLILAEEKQQLKSFHHYNSLNLGAVLLKLENYPESIYACTEALKIDQNNIKALFRRGQARAALKLYELALDDLQEAHKMSPENKKIQDEFKRVKKLLSEYRKIQKSAFSKLFN